MGNKRSELADLLPHGEMYILVDDDLWGTGEVIPGRRRRYFLEKNGRYGGPPHTDAVAIQELETLRTSGAGFIAFVWSSYWWFDHVQAFRDYLHGHYPCPLQNERVTVFDLGRSNDRSEKKATTSQALTQAKPRKE